MTDKAAGSEQAASPRSTAVAIRAQSRCCRTPGQEAWQGPGPEIFCRDARARDLLQIGVHICRAHILALAFLVDVLQQFLPRKVLAKLKTELRLIT
jgi:hypothetical protein